MLTSITACEFNVKEFFNDLMNDDALSYSNHYNPPASDTEVDPNAVIAQGVASKNIDDVPNAYCFKSINYSTDGKILNTYKTGGVNENEFNVNGNQDYNGSKSETNYDLYVPKDLKKNEKHVVLLFIHGGAWISGFKTDVNPYVFEFANRGYITATIKYTLLNKDMNDPSLSIFRNLDEIDACVSSIKAALTDLEFDTSKTNLVIGGASSGAHLAMLYSYSRGQNAALPIKFLVDAVGPVDIKPNNWKMFNYKDQGDLEDKLNAGLSYSAIEAVRSKDELQTLYLLDGSTDLKFWNEYQTMRVANGMCGMPYRTVDIEASSNEYKTEITNPNEASIAMTKVGGGEDQLSVTYWLATSAKIPVVCAYAGKDSIIGVAQYAALQKAMNDKGYVENTDYAMYYFKNSDHTNINPEFDETAYNGFVKNIDDWCKAI